MKHSIIISLTALTLFVSCENASYLDKLPYTQTTPEQFYRNENDMKLALIAAYEAMSTTSVTGQDTQGGTYNLGLMYIMSSPSDEVLSVPDSYQGQFTNFPKAAYTESTAALRNFWTAFYAGVHRCNTVLAHLDVLDDELKKIYEAEARFMRAFYYWYLAQNFGGVPIAVYGSDGMEARSPLEDVYDLILDDLRYAYAERPETGGILGTSSANMYTAAAYIGRVCNYLAACKRTGVGAELAKEQPLNDFSWVDEDAMSLEAYKALKDVVENSSYKLIDDFTDLFRETTKMAQNQECLFKVENYESSNTNSYPPTSAFGFAPTSNGGDGTPARVWAKYIIPTSKMFEMYSPKDPRRDWFFTGKYSEDVVAEELRGQVRYSRPYTRGSAATNSRTDSDNQTYLPYINGEYTCVGKYRFAITGQLAHSKASHSMSLPLMRLADVYLMYAEAIYYVDKDEDTAREWLRKVLSRACAVQWSNTLLSEKIEVVGKETTTIRTYDAKMTIAVNEALTDQLMEAYRKDDFIEELLESRERELAFECSRKYDLFCFNLLDQEINNLVKGREENGKFYTYDMSYKKFVGSIITFGVGSGQQTGIGSLKQNWRPYKMWLPISSLEISATNGKIVQNAKW